MVKVIVQNKKATHDYFVIDKYECGIVLKGTEIKSIRAGKVSINDAFGRIKNDEVFAININITKYKQGGDVFNHEETRERKLLLNKREIRKIRVKVEREGHTIVPLRLYLKQGLAKLEIGVCKGKKNYDKRDDLRKKDQDMRVKKALKNIDR